MKLIIAGGRDIKPSYGFIQGSLMLLKPFENELITEVVSDGELGVAMEGEHWASHMEVPVKRFETDWNLHGWAAGPIRNKEMAEYADVLLLIWDGKSRGSTSMRQEMFKLGKPVYEVVLLKILERSSERNNKVLKRSDDEKT